MELRLLILEGKTDVSFFLPLLKGIYRFKEDKEKCKTLPFSRNNEVSMPICLVRDNILLVILHTNGKNNIPRALKGILKSLERFEERPSLVGVARDADTEADVLNWTKSTLSEFDPVLKDSILVINGVKVVPFGIGNMSLEDPNIEVKKELELLLTSLARRESSLSKLQTSIPTLVNELERKLRPKDVMHLLAIIKNYDGDSMSGLYRKFLEKLIREQPELTKEFLSESGLKDFLGTLLG